LKNTGIKSAFICCDEPLVFMDAVHPAMATKVSYGWIKKGDSKLISQ